MFIYGKRHKIRRMGTMCMHGRVSNGAHGHTHAQIFLARHHTTVNTCKAGLKTQLCLDGHAIPIAKSAYQS